MCGRFTLAIPNYLLLAEEFGVEARPEHEEMYRPRYNIAPNDLHWIVREGDSNAELLPARWGLILPWMKDPSRSGGLINARAETADQKPSFREAFRKRRCLVPADGFFEWQGKKGAKEPIWFHATSTKLLRFAGLYERWISPNSQTEEVTFTILTTAANEFITPYHHRIPVILGPQKSEAWMGGASDEATLSELRPLLRAPANDLLTARRVSRYVNSAKHDDPQCLHPLENP